MNRNLYAAAVLLGRYTNGRFDVWALAGRHNVKLRQDVMTALVNGVDGKRLPQKECGITAMERKFWEMTNVQGDCIAARERNFREWCRENVGDAIPATARHC